MARIAIGEDHHPDLSVHYGRCVVSLTTHDAGGVTELDIELAHRFMEQQVDDGENALAPATRWQHHRDRGYGARERTKRYCRADRALADAGSASSFGTGSKLITDNAVISLSGAANMTSRRTIVTGGLGIGGTSIGVTTPGVSLTLNGAITNTPTAGSGIIFPQAVNFEQRAVAGAGGTVILDLAQPLISGGTTIHRQNLTLLNNTQLTVAPSSLGVGGAFNVGNSTGTDVGKTVVTAALAAVVLRDRLMVAVGLARTTFTVSTVAPASPSVVVKVAAGNPPCSTSSRSSIAPAAANICSTAKTPAMPLPTITSFDFFTEALQIDTP